jgi:hypothetical protein
MQITGYKSNELDSIFDLQKRLGHYCSNLCKITTLTN